MNPGRPDFLEMADRSGQFALERPTEIDLLHKLAHSELGLVKQLVPNISTRRHSLSGQKEAGVTELFL